ncbi:hypothetical protein CLG85_003685 [Yangia mangrovi]|uniref:Flagellin N-terminal domain-containing protein n=1 Tax=Alloyangia mangrovi TaxID=1779329 RepID=A0ABT2KGJ7_9RHOB|nr:hypothetical protein [Alloyangia mangrovi]MCT4369491.1 hypothetical protein [Alloyangia mangrovi]
MIYLSKGASTLYSSLLRRNQNADLSNALSRAEQELSTGYKSDIYKSIGLGATEALSLNARLDRDEAQSAANALTLSRIEMTTESLGSMRESVQEALELAVANSEYSANGVSGVQIAARAALDALIGHSAQAYSGMGLFSGTVNVTSALQPWSQAQSDSGLSPESVLAGLLSGGAQLSRRRRCGSGRDRRDLLRQRRRCRHQLPVAVLQRLGRERAPTCKPRGRRERRLRRTGG